MAKFYSTKTYGNDRGLSCAFRQWRATHSHCSLLHGYSLGFKLVFSCDELDERNWVQDFGGLKEFKAWLENTFDHTLAIAGDDPQLNELIYLGELGIAKVHVFPKGVGTERFAEAAWFEMDRILLERRTDGTALNPTVKIESVECFEHGANSAIYRGFQGRQAMFTDELSKWDAVFDQVVGGNTDGTA